MFIEVNNLTKIYSKYVAVNKVNFKIEKNKTIGLLGPNGCGKTTTIGMILGLLKPSKGKVLIDGIEIEKKRVDLLEKINLAVQINGKTRDIINIKKDLEEKDIYKTIINHSKAKKYIEDRKIIKTIFVKNKIINYIISE